MPNDTRPLRAYHFVINEDGSKRVVSFHAKTPQEALQLALARMLANEDDS